jgi:hypothetical protein
MQHPYAILFIITPKTLIDTIQVFYEIFSPARPKPMFPIAFIILLPVWPNEGARTMRGLAREVS